MEIDSDVVSHAWVGAGPTVAVDSTDSASLGGCGESPVTGGKDAYGRYSHYTVT